ncbi:Uncharacterized conserved protein YecT, DUF1311 family [Paracoccus alcaliphilus]|uniref:Uncharacterized conserved protein YecT, DUF1311 family n=1 Tax=Paracoccus alcaliphilus TaxID=34002 RepID=A0A1H8G9E2_9RHOB|nr:lysozyme inhibitor LprI family protein [Paracoccus alcaliphilus]WCR17901.1 DUF1311 domain-containing protein [Paracoccus alcaliphilus]SEN40603.1 Uncharacterized conserved protein YecT, DUF1311 family [Paracoccus alcaliphilus]
MRILTLTAALTILAGGAMAQEQPDLPQLDASVLETCLEGARGNGADGPESCIGKAATQCSRGANGQTTIGMSHCLGQELDLWDARLNETYDKLVALAEDTDKEMAILNSAAEKQLPHLQQMQKDWITYRDSACDYERSRWGGGTGGGPAQTYCVLTLTARQTIWLTNYLQQ